MKNSAGSAIPASNRPLWRNSAGKRCGAVEDVIAWAWREELPKAPKAAAGPEGLRSGWEKTDRFAEHLSLVDLYGVNRFGCVPDFSAESWPHADAVTIGEAVVALDGLELEMPEEWHPAPELDRFGGLGIQAVSVAWRRMTRLDGGATVLRSTPSDLIVRHAVLGSDAASLRLDDVREEVERWSNGKERWFVSQVQDRLTGRMVDGRDETVPTTIEVNGVDRRGKPMPGAYRKTFLDPDPVPVIMARAEHEILVSALAMVAELLVGRLAEIEVLPSRIPMAPWREAEGHRSRVLPDLVGQAEAEAAEQAEKREAFARRYPRWFRNLERAAARMAREAA